MRKKLLGRLTLLAIMLSFNACSTTQQAESIRKSGFLGDYSQLRKGGEEQALLRYVNPNVRWSRYNKIILKPVKIYAGKNSDLRNADREAQSALANYFTAALSEELKKDFTLVSTPGPGVMTIYTAITDADQSEVVFDTITTIMPIGLALSTMKRSIGESDSFVGDAQAEMEIVDSVSDVRLAAAVDKRYGSKALRSKFGGWNHAKETFDYWAERLRERLEAARSGEGF